MHQFVSEGPVKAPFFVTPPPLAIFFWLTGWLLQTREISGGTFLSSLYRGVVHTWEGAPCIEMSMILGWKILLLFKWLFLFLEIITLVSYRTVHPQRSRCWSKALSATCNSKNCYLTSHLPDTHLTLLGYICSREDQHQLKKSSKLRLGRETVGFHLLPKRYHKAHMALGETMVWDYLWSPFSSSTNNGH